MCFLPQVPVHMFLDLSTLECTHLSEPVELFALDLMNNTANYTDKEVKVSFCSRFFRLLSISVVILN